MTDKYTVRYWAGPRDGGEEQITCGYPPATLHGYQISHSKVGRYYVYVWPRPARTATPEEPTP